ncbi:ubiquitin carboxyl-terminal hydrolase 5 isoform X2 [Copidosoma floridanum]|uniref:ubiquitin carboxyl-terminal hydrolase 5 isoform X2 n=1 Tax=Copidosoma floridanum TaxID=29053 RepID=UPI000C6F84F2|nr:ubiquitin carboxyl-terminal hydrolase 5 isoform X2 [Copidosoma floridanum]
MEELKNHLSKVRIPGPDTKIYKDECALSFDTPETSTGLYVCLTTFLGFGRDYVLKYYERSGHNVYFHIKRTKHEVCLDQASLLESVGGPDKKITRLAIGTPGGFNPNLQKYIYKEEYALVILPEFITIPYSDDDEQIHKQVKESVNRLLKAESALKVAEREALDGTWDGEIRAFTKHTDLLQLDNGKKIPPSGWTCEKCDLTTNLWLNLTDGSIMCGRKFYDGTGGNDHAVEHYRNTQYPLAVKLGTISRDGKADVYSYDEDDMVQDPNLAVHLSHWGINIANMEKTEKSMIELELELNQKFGDWIVMQEGGTQLTPLYGPGYTGLVNLGNSCYMNSVIQVCFSMPDFMERYVKKADDIFYESFNDPINDFNTQMAKLGNGLLSGKYSQPPDESNKNDDGRQGISPRMFKNLIGRGHPGFMSNRQQDAQEFLLHLINALDRNSRHQLNPSDGFKFRIEERYQCSSGKVKYTYRPDYLLPLPIPMDMVLNKEEVAAYEQSKSGEDKSKIDLNTIVRPRIKLSSCIESFAKTETVEQFYSTALNSTTTATKYTRLASFPDFLFIHLKKFTVKEDWTSVKLDVAMEVPDTLDLSSLRGSGLQQNEELLPESKVASPPLVYDQAILTELTEMGFPIEACKRSLYFTQNSGLQTAINWLMYHISDDDFTTEFVPPDDAASSETFVPNQESLEMVMSMGFTREQATVALKATNNNLERAADWALNHISELDGIEMEDNATAVPSQPTFRDGSGKYKLIGFITHMGTSTMVGHYVCHLLKDGKWVMFNDEKVYLSENPPKELGYIYLYQRLE